MIKKIDTSLAPKAVGAYSQGIVSNGMVYTSGQIAINPSNNQFIDGDITTQTEQVISNIKNILIEANSELDKVVKVNVYLKNINDFTTFNNIYKKYFTSEPARSTIEVSNLPKNALIEIDCIALID